MGEAMAVPPSRGLADQPDHRQHAGPAVPRGRGPGPGAGPRLGAASPVPPLPLSRGGGTEHRGGRRL
jgi:hypothetical protein